MSTGSAEGSSWSSRITSAVGVGASHLGVQVKPLQRVYDQRILGESVVHDQTQTVQEGRSLDDALKVGVIQTLVWTDERESTVNITGPVNLLYSASVRNQIQLSK